MTPATAELLSRIVTDNLHLRSPHEQAQVYEALAEILPSEKDKLAAQRVAFSIRETAKLQMDFLRVLITTPPPPTNDGPTTGL